MTNSQDLNRGEAFEAADDIPANQHLGATIGDVLMRRYGRRQVTASLLATTAAALLFGPGQSPPAQAEDATDRFRFEELPGGVDETHHLATDHTARILLRWGDPVFADSAPFDPLDQSPAAQLTQFGYNNDYLGFLPLDGRSDRGLLCVNHEFTNQELMFPGIGVQYKIGFPDMTRRLVDIEMAAHGATVVEIELDDEAWRPVLNSRYNRRISPLDTWMALDGPAAGHERLKTRDDPEGVRVLGTLNNCAGGITPWGTCLTAEENFHGYFWTDGSRADTPGGDHAESYRRYGVPGKWYNWGQHHDRFNVDREPNEPNRFGWVVEIDPWDPSSVPVKHTAMGRFRHEGAECLLAEDGRAVVYMGDDARFDYLYRFVSSGTFRDGDRAANRSLLSDGTLSVARFDADGTMTWLPLRFGSGPLTPENGFRSQGDVLIDARLAADALGATPMDRPEDVQPDPGSGRVYVMLTNNAKRKPDATDPVNPRSRNWSGHIIELTAPHADHTADTYRWEILVKCGNPAIAGVGSTWNPATSADGWFASPDNCVIDGEGRLWVATDQGKQWQRTGKADGLYSLETQGPLRGRAKLFFRCPVGAELCGPCFTPDGETLFVSVQHPGADGTQHFAGFERLSTFADPATRWPDFDPNMPPRPSVVAIRRTGGGRVGD